MSVFQILPSQPQCLDFFWDAKASLLSPFLSLTNITLRISRQWNPVIDPFLDPSNLGFDWLLFTLLVTSTAAMVLFLQ